jgi:hypothetical protein
MLQECVTSPSGKETKFIAKALSSLQLDSRVLDGAQAKILRMIADRVVGDVPEKDKYVLCLASFPFNNKN